MIISRTYSLLISKAISIISMRNSGGSLSKGNGALVVKTLFPTLIEKFELVPCTALVIPRAEKGERRLEISLTKRSAIAAMEG